jgi:soluble lytic murein transglycosylase-like protein
MLEGLTSAMSRVEEIKARFRQTGPGGAVATSPHLIADPNLSRPTLQPVTPIIPTSTPSTKVKGSVETFSAYDDVIDKACAKYGVDPSLVKAVVRAESGFSSRAESRSGARGLMQLMPSTAAELGVDDLFDPEQNIDAGVRYMKQQLDRFGNEKLALAAYNAGPASVVKHHGIPPFRETQSYVDKVIGYRNAIRSR